MTYSKQDHQQKDWLVIVIPHSRHRVGFRLILWISRGLQAIFLRWSSEDELRGLTAWGEVTLCRLVVIKVYFVSASPWRGSQNRQKSVKTLSLLLQPHAHCVHGLWSDRVIKGEGRPAIQGRGLVKSQLTFLRISIQVHVASTCRLTTLYANTNSTATLSHTLTLS